MRRGLILWVLIFATVCGCGTKMRNKQLKMVAKDWCMTIRASQVVPVYPLTEDLHVGDIFLVQRTVDDQHREYEEKGFLSMENLIARLQPRGFQEFYLRSFGLSERELTLPKDWLGLGEDVTWDRAPGASFPTYSFSVRSGAGLNLAVPVQSVPIGLSLMGADAGEGTITIGEAKTYGIDTISLYDDVLDWECENHTFLLRYASTKAKTNYVRVISRVYLTGKINVSITGARSQAGSLSAGAPKPVELPSIKGMRGETDLEETTAENYRASINALNKSIEEGLRIVKKKGTETVLPGGTQCH